MPKRYRQSIALLGVMIVAFAWYFGYVKYWRKQSAESEEAGKQITALKKEDVTEFAYVRITNAPDGVNRPADFQPITTKVTLKKIGKDWNLIEPVEDLADNGTVDAILSTLLSAKQERVVDEAPKDLATYGLDQPAIVATIKGKGPAETVKIGANTPTGYSSYALPHGQKAVWRVSKSVRTSFEKDLFALRNKLVVPVTRADLQEVEVSAKGGGFLVKKETGDKWMIAREGVPADATEWSKALNLWLDARAIQFPETKDKKLSSFGLDNPKAKLTFTKATDGAKVVLVLGKATVDGKARFFAKRLDKDTVFEVDGTALETAERPSVDLMDKQLSRFNRFEIARVKVTRKDGDFELAKNDKGGWEMVAPKTDKRVDVPRVDALLTKLQDTKVAKYEPSKTKLSPGAVTTTIQLFAKKGNEIKEAVTVRFGAKNGKFVSGDRSDTTTPFTLDAANFAPFDVAAAYYTGEGKTVGAPETPKAPEKKDGHDGHDHGPDDGHGHG